jgi:RNA polymerase sigma factor (sigma-70 family)
MLQTNLNEETYKTIYWFCRRKLGCTHEDAEDLTQEAHIRYHTNHAKDQTRITPLAWMTTVARNRWIDIQRGGQGKTQNFSNFLDTQGNSEASVQTHDNFLNKYFPAVESVESVVCRNNALWEIYQQLSQENKKLLILLLSDCDYSQIEKELDVTYSNAKMRVLRLRRSLVQYKKELQYG